MSISRDRTAVDFHMEAASHRHTVDMDTALAFSSVGPGGRHPLPHPEAFEAAMRAAGVSNDRPVVVYDNWWSITAARAWWLLQHHGHGDAFILDEL